MRLIIPPVAVLALVCNVDAAPALKGQCVEGELRILSGRDPVVVVKERTPEGTWNDVTYWLVFTKPETESDTRKIGEGAAVKVRGTVGAGGQYRYVIVEKVTE